MSEPARALEAPPVAEASTRCANCDAAVSTSYCGSCGQRQGDLRPTVRELVTDVTRYFLRVDGKFLRTVRQLFRPGFLTREYLRGRREAYEKPFKLFVVLNVLFFLAAGAVRSTTFDAAATQGILDGFQQVVVGHERANAARVRSGAEPSPESRPVRLARRVLAQPREQLQLHIRETYLRWGPRLMFAMIPLTALFFFLIYRRRGLNFAEHFVFCLHYQAFATIVSLPAQLGGWQSLALGLTLVDGLYLLLAMRAVYGDGWWGTGWRFAAVSALAFLTRIALTNALIFWAVLG